jgi:Zinc dependent phospholipase C
MRRARYRSAHVPAPTIMKNVRISIFAMLVFLLLGCGRDAAAYSLLTHEQLIDLTWQDAIVPLLLSRYPKLTPTDLDRARAYAYGGCVIQDIGYYPFGDRSFSNLTHYVRSGDFVTNLFRNARNANELAFAVGALSHYIGDTVGHSEATNIAVPVEFAKLRARYGPVVSYAEGEHQHVRTEFAFDIDEIAHHRMAPLRYLRHIGLKVPVRLVGLAFYQTYGLTDFAGRRAHRFKVREYRWAVRTFIPRIAYSVTVLHRKDEPAEPNTPDAIEIEREAAAVGALNHWDSYRGKGPRLETYLLAAVLYVLPKLGPLSLVAVRGPTVATEADYMHSVAQATATLRYELRRFTPVNMRQAVPAGAIALAVPIGPLDPLHPLPNRDLDTGHVVEPGGYQLTDSTYASLLHRITQQPTQAIPPGIKQDIEAYYSNPQFTPGTAKNAVEWARVQADLKVLATMRTSKEPTPFLTYGDDPGDE